MQETDAFQEELGTFQRDLIHLRRTFKLPSVVELASAGLTAMWPIYLNPMLYERGVNLLSRRLAGFAAEKRFSCISGIPVSGNALAVSLGVQLGSIPVILLPKDYFAMLDWEGPKAELKGKDVLLVDSVTRSGLSASISFECVEWAGGNPIGVASLFYDDVYDQESRTVFFRNLCDAGRFWHLVKTSDLESLEQDDSLAEDARD